MKIHEKDKSLLTSYDNDWYELVLQAKQQGLTKAEVREIIRKLKESHHLKEV